MAPLFINGSTGISGVDGTAGTPAVQGTDSNTGISFPAPDTIAVNTNGVQRASVDSAGRLLVNPTSANTNGGILQLSGGITFPATQVNASDPNTLDDYEEGTWTPATNSPGGLSFGGTPRYTKVGRMVTINVASVSFTATTNGATLQLTGLPFTANNDNNGTAALVSTNASMQRIIIPANTSHIFFYPNQSQDTTNITNGTAGNTTVYALSATYFV